MQDNKTTKTPVEFNTREIKFSTQDSIHQHKYLINNYIFIVSTTHKIWKFQEKYQIQYVGSHKYKIETRKTPLLQNPSLRHFNPSPRELEEAQLHMEEDEATKRSSNAQFMVEGWWKSEEMVENMVEMKLECIEMSWNEWGMEKIEEPQVRGLILGLWMLRNRFGGVRKLIQGKETLNLRC